MTAFIINIQEELHAETVDRRGSQDACDLPWPSNSAGALGRLGQKPLRVGG